MGTRIGNKSPEDKVIFAPIEEIRRIEHIVDNLDKVCREFQKVAAGMKSIKS